MNKPLLTIIIPVYNVEKYIAKCLESLIPQLNDDVEVLLVNDGSTDNSELICKKYCNKKIKFITQENKGLSAARNLGIEKANGKYISFLDSDDYLSESAVSILLSNIKEKNPDIFFIRSQSFVEEGIIESENQLNYSTIRTKEPIKIFREFDNDKNFWFAAWLIIIKYDFLLENNLFFKEGIYHEDELWVPIVFMYAESIELIDSCIYCYRLNRKGSIISEKNIKKELDKSIIIDALNYELNKLNGQKSKAIRMRCAALEFGMIKKFNSIMGKKNMIH